MSDTSPQSEYYDAMVDLLEWLWGRDFMAPGGEGNIRKMMQGIDARDKDLLDIGSGLGGPAFVLARDYGAQVTGIDLEPQLVERANQRKETLGLADRVDFLTVELGPLPFPDAHFDVVFSSGAITQTEDKAGIFAECLRVLRPGGVLTIYDWLKSEGELSEDMLYFYEMEGLTYNMVTLHEMAASLRQAGFEILHQEDASDWYRREARREHALLSGEGYERVVDLIGQKDADHLIEDWRSMVVVCDKGELRQGYTRARRPRA
jgi:ubiquinone/menaquinone biosynthesis C-methylase UbiE